MKEIYGSGDAIPFIYISGLIILMNRMSQKMYRNAMLFVVIIPYVFYSLATTKMTSFCIIVSPIFFLGLGSLVDSKASFLDSKTTFSKFDFIFRSTTLIVICSFLIDLQKIQDRHTSTKTHVNSYRNTKLKELDFIKKIQKQFGQKKLVILNTNTSVNSSIPIMFFTDFVAYDYVPSEYQIEQIQSKNYEIAIMDNDKLPEYIKNNKEIIKIKL